VAIAVVILSPILRAVATPLFSTHFPIYCLTLFRADTLAFGAFIALSERECTGWIRQNRKLALRVSIVAGMMLAGFSIFPTFRTGLNSVFFNSLGYSLSVAIFGGILIYTLGMSEGPLHTLLIMSPVRFLGRISYTFYLYHVAVLLKFDQWTSSHALVALFSFIVTFALAAASWRFLELPILKVRPTPAYQIPRIAAAA
jgi:peptidoglycan/LPS O-acetylase OafA/YrhL